MYGRCDVIFCTLKMRHSYMLKKTHYQLCKEHITETALGANHLILVETVNINEWMNNLYQLKNAKKMDGLFL